MFLCMLSFLLLPHIFQKYVISVPCTDKAYKFNKWLHSAIFMLQSINTVSCYGLPLDVRERGWLKYFF